MLWNDIKGWIQENYPEHMTYSGLHEAVKAAWKAISKQRLDELMHSMHNRCQAVIDANGEHAEH